MFGHSRFGVHVVSFSVLHYSYAVIYCEFLVAGRQRKQEKMAMLIERAKDMDAQMSRPKQENSRLKQDNLRLKQENPSLQDELSWVRAERAGYTSGVGRGIWFGQ